MTEKIYVLMILLLLYIKVDILVCFYISFQNLCTEIYSVAEHITLNICRRFYYFLFMKN